MIATLEAAAPTVRAAQTPLLRTVTLDAAAPDVQAAQMPLLPMFIRRASVPHAGARCLSGE